MTSEQFVDSRWWPAIATLAVVSWSLVFWWVGIVVIGLNVLHIPLGLGGAVYPMLFLPPVLIAVAIYQLTLRKYLAAASTRATIFWTVALPCVVVAIALVALCPTDRA